MKSGLLLQIAATFGLLSLVSIGGANASLPEIHRQAVDTLHWMNDQTFANLIAIGQAAPGPNVLIVSLIGWRVVGFAGLLVASFAIVIPSSLLAIAVGRGVRRYAAVGWVGVAKRALAPLAVGFMVASGYVMTRAAYEGLLSIAIVALTTAITLQSRRSPLISMAGGALIGLGGHRLHIFG